MLSDVVADQLVRHRKRAGMTREQLAEQCSQLGWPGLTFGVIGSIETGRRVSKDAPRRREVTVDELIGLGVALGVPPALLITPLGEPDMIEMLPGKPDDAWTAYRWFIGEFPTEMVGEARDPAVNYFRSDGEGALVTTYRKHHNALHSYLLLRAEKPAEAESQIGRLAAARIEMHQAGWPLPAVPVEVADLLEPPLRAWGFRSAGDTLIAIGPTAPDLGVDT